jgi:SET domain-containing protein
LQKFCYLNKNTDVKESPVHGLCRYALTDIKKDEIIFVIGGIAKRPSESEWYKGLLIDEDLVLDLPINAEYEAFINHSCDPNVYIDGQVIFRALRDIKKNDFITVDYGTFMLTKKDYIPDCKCGSSNCRGKVTGEDYKFLNLPLSWYAQKRKNNENINNRKF